jgi:hypothetical protein
MTQLEHPVRTTPADCALPDDREVTADELPGTAFPRVLARLVAARQDRTAVPGGRFLPADRGGWS